jgi:hypothetical protein
MSRSHTSAPGRRLLGGAASRRRIMIAFERTKERLILPAFVRLQ